MGKNIKKLVSIFSLLFILSIMAVPVVFAQNTGYQLLAPLPGIGSNIPIEPGGFAKYLQNIFNIVLGIAIALSVIMIVIGGAQYLSTDAVFGTEMAKKKITNALWGLLIALGTYLILFTINPDILKLNLTITPLRPPVVGTIPFGTVDKVIYKPCNDCVTINSTGLPHKKPGPAGRTGSGCLNEVTECQINKDLASRLQKFKQELGSDITWTISESWPPTIKHNDIRHRTGDTVDVGITQRTVTVINRVYDAAEKSGLSAQWEVGTADRAEQLRKAGAKLVVFVPAVSVVSGMYFIPSITDEHFSFYKK